MLIIVNYEITINYLFNFLCKKYIIYIYIKFKEIKGKLKMEDNKLINEISKLRESVDETNVLLKEIKDYLNKSSIDEIIYYVRKKSIR